MLILRWSKVSVSVVLYWRVLMLFFVIVNIVGLLSLSFTFRVFVFSAVLRVLVYSLISGIW